MLLPLTCSYVFLTNLFVISSVVCSVASPEEIDVGRPRSIMVMRPGEMILKSPASSRGSSPGHRTNPASRSRGSSPGKTNSGTNVRESRLRGTSPSGSERFTGNSTLPRSRGSEWVFPFISFPFSAVLHRVQWQNTQGRVFVFTLHLGIYLVNNKCITSAIQEDGTDTHVLKFMFTLNKVQIYYFYLLCGLLRFNLI